MLLPVRGRNAFFIFSLGWVLLTTSFGSKAAYATSFTVPDDFATIQDAIYADSDTVLVRSGNYPEVPIVWRGVHILAIASGPAPIVGGLLIRPEFPYLYEATYGFSGLNFQGAVNIENNQEQSVVEFNGCEIHDGIADISQFQRTASMALRKCAVWGVADLLVGGNAIVDSCTFTNGRVDVSFDDATLTVTNSHFQGTAPNVYVIHGDGVHRCRLSGNTVRNGRVGVTTDDWATVLDNIVQDGIIDVEGYDVVVRRNQVSGTPDGYKGIVASATSTLDLSENRVEDAPFGIVAYIDDMFGGSITKNVVSRCGDGISVFGNTRQPFSVAENTSVSNRGSGFICEVEERQPGCLRFERNIGAYNRDYGLRMIAPTAGVISCNDWFENGLGAITGTSPSVEDLEIDPQFCDRDSGDYHLRKGSPLLPGGSCGLVGALDAGCAATAALISLFTVERNPDGVRLRWQTTGGALNEIWVERSGAAGGPWIRPVMERTLDGDVTNDLDRSALAEREYWYRLVAREESESLVIGEPVSVLGNVARRFELTRVAPNPGSDPLRISFTLARAAAVEMNLIDLQGRLVASLVHGSLAAGTHEVEWSGRSTKPGMYFVEYRYPGGRQMRRVVRVR